MMEETDEFRVSADELEYLKQLVSRDESLAGLLRFQEGAAAAIGFDKNHSPNEQGQMLKQLIDRFYVS